jgi:hypothetical protein
MNNLRGVAALLLQASLLRPPQSANPSRRQ